MWIIERTKESLRKINEKRIGYFVRQILIDSEILAATVDLERLFEIQYGNPDEFRKTHGYYESARKLQKVEDVNFRHYLPHTYKIVLKLIGSPNDRWKHAVEARLQIENIIKNTVSKPLLIDCRAKSNFSIWLKMRRQDKDADEIYDQIGIRIVADNPADAQKVIEKIKEKIPLVQPHEFRRSKSGSHSPVRGSLEHPKESGYAAIHLTCVLEQLRFDVQVTTRQLFIDMHEKTDLPAKSVARYKEI